MNKETANNESVLETRGLVKSYRMGDETVHAVDGLDIRVNRGEFVSIMGPSGSGKTTLLNILGCIDRASGGDVYIAGKLVSSLTDRELDAVRLRRIGFVFQRINLLPILDARENVELPMELAGRAANDRRERAETLLSSVGLKGRSRHKPSQLSAGEQQRVGIARALANDPDVLLADEPTGNLDSRTTRDIMELLRRIHRERGLTIVLVTHNPEVGEAADRCVHMRDGRVVDDIRAGG